MLNCETFKKLKKTLSFGSCFCYVFLKLVLQLPACLYYSINTQYLWNVSDWLLKILFYHREMQARTTANQTRRNISKLYIYVTNNCMTSLQQELECLDFSRTDQVSRASLINLSFLFGGLRNIVRHLLAVYLRTYLIISLYNYCM